ncbi:MAG: amidohydrolase [Defluviitaleaceae bacterium]|nr:amidohydrolase [Defluviitaleaceae bacterium]MCL2239659.1 amidohydrolase [Defluviitaleaceae bacterium]
MKIIDAHVHFSNVQAFFTAAEESGVDYSYEGYLRERAAAGIEASICMGLVESVPHGFPDKDARVPMTADLCPEPPPGLYTCLGINPHGLDDAALARIAQRIKQDKTVVGFKIYAGYYHRYIHDPVYTPIYKLAAEHGLTVAIHTGDTYSEQGLLEYSHPLAADRLAVQFRDTKFLLCHMGNPWVLDACEIAYKNRNVFLDISGLEEGNAAKVAEAEKNRLIIQHLTTGLAHLDDYQKVLFGTDWPIVPMEAYIHFCKQLIPPQAHESVFYHNALRVYGIGG